MATVADNDYIANSATLVFAPGKTSRVFAVEIVGDTKFEAEEEVKFPVINMVIAECFRNLPGYSPSE